MGASNHDQLFVVQRNGRPAGIDDLASLAFAGHAHFTAMQVRGGAVRGLDLHLQRLRHASLAMFGQALPDGEVRAALRTALQDGPSDLSLLATVYSPAGEFTAGDGGARPALLVRTAPPSDGPAGPLALATYRHERFLPEVKLVGEAAKTWLLRRAAERGFDDAAFVDSRGRLSEASIWNLAFWDGAAVVWPRADKLRGTTMGVLSRQLSRLGVAQREQDITLDDLPRLQGAVVMNSWTPGVPVNRIEAVAIPEAPSFVDVLHRAFQAEPLVAP
jgi:branched-subunit amino acid aminotransferase/4-amino-4-deoxychorismate lyase